MPGQRWQRLATALGGALVLLLLCSSTAGAQNVINTDTEAEPEQ